MAHGRAQQPRHPAPWQARRSSQQCMGICPLPADRQPGVVHLAAKGRRALEKVPRPKNQQGAETGKTAMPGV
jgi:hypothetical protein